MNKVTYRKRIRGMSFEIHEFYQRIKNIPDDELVDIELKDLDEKFHNKWWKAFVENNNDVVKRPLLRKFGKVITALNDEFTYIGKDIDDDEINADCSIFLINDKKF